ncbi:diguanylate cyclase [Clostridium sp.]|uniref:sensor domain-containing diguanylate cyclase n=1 Tax=Clostridium sp. TaxID=1506 RepID=UPI001A444C88|nr:diguanylate cyclase [Clostridium sp.]MBK5236053.1 diguanylate cyclase [Clostridium sp.]
MKEFKCICRIVSSEKGVNLMQQTNNTSHMVRGIRKIKNIYNYFSNRLFISENFNIIQNIIETSTNLIFYKDRNNIYRYCNLAFAQYLGLKKEEIIGHPVFEISPTEIIDIILKADKHFINNEDMITYKSMVNSNNGFIHEIIFTKDNTFNTKNIVVTMNDITKLIMSQKSNERNLNLNQAILEINKIIIDNNDIVEICNLVLDKITDSIELADAGCVLVFDKNENLNIIASKGYDTEQCKKFSISLTDSFYYKKNNGKIDNPIIINDIQKFDWNEYTDFWKRSQVKIDKAVLINDDYEVDWIKYSKLLESSLAITVESSIATPIVFDNHLYGFINIDSTENNAFHESDLEVMNYIKYQIEVGISKFKIYEETIFLSRYDGLTTLCNRRYFDQLFYDAVKNATNKSQSFYMAMFDLNDLKVVNDTYGHLAGDELIKDFADRLRSTIKDTDILGRLGGDEFAAIFFGVELEVLYLKLENINENFRTNPLIYEGNTIIGSVSFGISEFPKDGLDYNKLFKKADKNMYKHKQKIKNHVCLEKI